MEIEEMEKFSGIIFDIVKKDDIRYIDAIIEYCEKVGMEVESAATLFTPKLLSKITSEARSNNLIPKEPMLPI